jgi:PEP-CTERM motif
MRNFTKALGFLVLCLALASPAFADTFSWSYSGGTDSGSGTFTATPSGTPGQELITGITGTFDGSSITSLLGDGGCCSSPADDNVLIYPANPAYLDINGVGFGFMAGVVDVNIYYCNTSAGCTLGSGYSVLMAPASMAPGGGVVLTSENGTFNVVSRTPEPATLLMLGTGLVGLVFRKRS